MAKTTRVGAVLLALVLAAAAMLLALVGPLAKPAQTKVAAAPPTLTGESLEAVSCRSVVDPNALCASDDLPGEVTVTSTLDPFTCAPTATSGVDTISYVARGTATGPYPGTFTESGTFTLGSGGAITSFTADFTIKESPIGEVTGKKSAQNLSASLACLNLLGAHVIAASVPEGQVGYEAEIVTRSSGTYIDRGTATGSASDPLDLGTTVEVYTVRGVPGEGLLGDLLGENGQLDSFGETFISDLAQVERVLPTTKAQCKNGGYEQFGFKNQGECEKAVNGS